MVVCRLVTPCRSRVVMMGGLDEDGCFQRITARFRSPLLRFVDFLYFVFSLVSHCRLFPLCAGLLYRTSNLQPMSLPDKRPDNDIFLLSKDETGERVYRAVWDEFYTWEQRNCLTMLHGLHQPVLLPEPLPSDDLSESDGDPLHSELNEYRDWFTIEIHDAPGSILDVDLLPLKLKLLDEGISPYPSYAACTPASSNTQCDKNFRDKASFTPFSDDPMFKKGDYLSLFNSFAWQTDFWDPDSTFSCSPFCVPSHPSSRRNDIP